MDSLIDKICGLHESLQAAELPHAFGGALALAWCTERARGTIDIDVNLLIPQAQFQRVLDALPVAVKVTRDDRKILQRDGQVRVWWDRTPLDLFLNSTEFHEELLGRVSWESFADRELPFLSCYDLAVFKAFFNRTKDWADLEAMYSAGTLDISRVQATLIEYLGADDERIVHLSEVASSRLVL